VSFVYGFGDDLTVECNKAEIDTVICFDGLQRVERPVELLTRLATCVPENGRILIHVPQGPEIYGRLDQRLGHRLRFSQATLKESIAEAGLELKWIRDFNRLGRWFWHAHAKDRESISPIVSRVSSIILPLAKVIDRLGIGRGLSLLAVAKKSPSRRNLD
jgi:hypothetical protein